MEQLKAMFQGEELDKAEYCVDQWKTSGEISDEGIASLLKEWTNLHTRVQEAQDLVEEMPNHPDFRNRFVVQICTSPLELRQKPQFAVAVQQPTSRSEGAEFEVACMWSVDQFSDWLEELRETYQTNGWQSVSTEERRPRHVEPSQLLIFVLVNQMLHRAVSCLRWCLRIYFSKCFREKKANAYGQVKTLASKHAHGRNFAWSEKCKER